MTASIEGLKQMQSVASALSNLVFCEFWRLFVITKTYYVVLVNRLSRGISPADGSLKEGEGEKDWGTDNQEAQICC